MAKYLEGRCPECKEVVAAAVKIDGERRSDWEGSMADILESGLIARLVNETPSLDGCKDGCSKKP